MMNDFHTLVSSIPYIGSFLAGANTGDSIFNVCAAFFIANGAVSTVNGDPLPLLDNVTYISGTLGTGKTGLGASIAERFLKKYRKGYSTFELKGVEKFDLFEDEWPEEENIFIIIDELLIMQGNGMIDEGKFLDGCALARQKNQRLILISQHHRPDFGRANATIGVYILMSGISFPPFGRLCWIKYSSSPFTRIMGFKGVGTKRKLLWIPGRVFKSYNSRHIWGYTISKEGEKFSRAEMAERRMAREAELRARKRGLSGSPVPAAQAGRGKRSAAPDSPPAGGLHKYDW